MKVIQIIGTGCPKCRLLQRHAEQAAKELGLDVRIEKVMDLEKIADMGVLTTPALAVDGKVKVSGRVPGVEQVKLIISG